MTNQPIEEIDTEGAEIDDDEPVDLSAEDVLMAIVMRAVKDTKKFNYDVLLQVLREYECIDIIGDARGLLLAEETAGSEEVNEAEVYKLLSEIDSLELEEDD